ncbi:IS66 family insertion sequence element accessory protein TnpB [Acidithiobacillus sp. VAN18-1]|uniref:IS66 family insertion sequence element accessory protein TnpB n=1 Tax=Igneacidithiobacillus copahuensis TaxID=2724909 RepID=A0AAE3CKM6_9PROT|nr:IS66 family insertion sequence element accessory protein TnpB [Igneacidithiobacillus copahuensis]MBU2788914.1 IS66 family insertion sequence element accessory protein TnpB [Igneacidithiobacillus copahuensis]
MMKEEKRELWRARVEDFRGSGLTVGAYCAREGIAVSSLHYWRKRFGGRLQQKSAAEETGPFLPVTLTYTSPVPAAGVMEIRLLSGRVVVLSAPVDTGWLRTLVQVLETPCG